MKLDFNISHLRSNQLTTKNNTQLIRFIKNRQQLMGLTNLELVKRMGFANTTKALRRLGQFEQTGQLPETYTQKLSQALGFNVAEITQIKKQHNEHVVADMHLFIQHFDQIWLHRKVIIRHRDYANISFPGLYLSVAYLTAPKYNLGLLLQHYMNGHWMVEEICCDRVFIVGAGGSPLSGNNSCHGFCIGCRNRLSFKLPAFGFLLKAHHEMEAACEQRPTTNTLADLLREFPR